MKAKVFFLLALLLACGCKITYPSLPHDSVRLPRGAAVAGIELSGQSIARSRSALEARCGRPVLTLHLPGETVRVPAAAFGIDHDYDLALLSALNGTEVSSLPLRIDGARLSAACADFSAEHGLAPTDATVVFQPDASEPFAYTEAESGWAIVPEALAAAVRSSASSGILDVAVPVTETPPSVTRDDLAAVRVKICEFSTSFSGATLGNADRVHNIKKAAGLIHGTVLSPSETFDCNAVLGDRNAENGWREANGIRAGAYVQEYGGGVCQVSTTLFNAALLADMEIAERSPHSWPMSYVDIGRDATISTGGKNFRFTNTGTADVTIGMTVDTEAHTLTCALYGAPLPDGASIRITSECTGTLDELPGEVLLDESLPYNTRIVEREGRIGKTAKTYRHWIAADGTAGARELLYTDAYRSISALEYVSADLYENGMENS